MHHIKHVLNNYYHSHLSHARVQLFISFTTTFEIHDRTLTSLYVDVL